MIPKILHYCWFGRNPKPKIVCKCMESWKKYLPDYEIREWNEDNFDIHICPYVEQAYAAKKWAYVSDYCRFYVLNKYGGVYVDTDVEFVKNIDNLLFSKFMGFAQNDIINSGLIMATTANDWFCQELLNSYVGNNFVFDNPNKVLAIGKRGTSIFVKHGLQLNGLEQKVEDYIIYPSYMFNPTQGDAHYKLDGRAYSIHHYAATWFPKGARMRNRIRQLIGSKNLRLYNKIKKFFSL